MKEKPHQFIYQQLRVVRWVEKLMKLKKIVSYRHVIEINFRAIIRGL